MERTTSSNRGNKWLRICSFAHIWAKTNKKEVIDAKKRKIENIEIHGVYECVLDIGQKCISTRYVIMEKFKDK